MMELKKSPVSSNNLPRKLLTRQSTQTNLKEKVLTNSQTVGKWPKRLPRSGSNVCLSKLENIEGFMPKHFLQRDIDAFKLSNELYGNPMEKPKLGSLFNAQNKEESSPNSQSSNLLSKGRILKSQTLTRKNEGSEHFVVSSLFKNNQFVSAQPSPMNQDNAHFRKESFETLLSFFNRSSSKTPTRIYPQQKRIEAPDFVTTPQHKSSNDSEFRKFSNLARRIKTEIITDFEPENTQDQPNWAYVEQVISDLVIATGKIFSWKALDIELAKILSKKKEEYWNELILEHEPEVVEILVVNMMELMVKRHTEMELISGEGIAEKIEEHIKEESPHNNEGLHLLVYFHKKQSKKKILVLSKYCFYFARNSHFNEDLKTEKDVIIFYFLILGLCQTRITIEHEPIRKIKIGLIKERAIKILKGEEIPPKPILEWVGVRFNNHSIVQKTFFNLNNISTASSTYLFNIRSYIKSRYSKLSLLSSEELKTKNDSLFKKTHITQVSVVPFIQQLALPSSNLLAMRNSVQTLAGPNIGEMSGEINLGRRTPVLKKRTKTPSHIREKMTIKIEDLNPKTEPKSTKAVTSPTLFETLSPKGNKTATFFFKPDPNKIRPDDLTEEVFATPEIINLKMKRNAKRNLTATPTLRRPKRNTAGKGSQGLEALSPWLERAESPMFDQSPLGLSPNNVILKSLAEGLLDEDEERPLTLRAYLEDKETKVSET